MSTLEEQLALFEKEVLAEAQPQAASDAVVDQPPKPAVNNDAPKPQPARPIAAPPMAPRVVAARPTFTPIGPTARPAAMGLPPPGPMTNFIPNQLRLPPPMPPFMRPPHFPPMPPQMPAPVVIQSGPTLYASAAAANGAASADGLSASKKKKQAGKDGDQSTPGSSGLKTMVLPSDVELLAAKRQAAKSHDNSYLGQVMRGEKKMKRFVRTGGGQIWEDPSLAEWDPNDFRIFCGDLGNEVSDELLAKAFRKYPSFQKAKVVRDNRTNKSKGYGFVSFKHQDDFIRACREMDGKYVGNRPIKLRKSNWKERNLDMVRKKDREKKKLGLTM